MEGVFDINQVYNRLAGTDYTGAAKYIRSFTFANPDVQRQMNNFATVYENSGSRLEQLLAAAGDNDDIKQKLAFSFQREIGFWGNNDDYRNSYSNKYINAIRNLGSKDGTKANYIDFSIATENTKRFKSLVGDEIFSEDSGQGWIPRNGKQVYRVSINNLLDAKKYDELRKNLEQGAPEIVGYEERWGGSYKDTHAAGYKAIGVSQDNKELGEVSFWEGFKDINNLIDDANNTKKNLENIGLTKQVVGDIITKPYMCNAQWKMMNDIMSGRIDKELGKWALEQIDDFYKTKLSTEALTGYDVFATEINGDTMNFSLIEDSKDKTELTHMLRTALKENRVKYCAGACAGRTGVYISISATLDKDGNPIDNQKGDISLFVPGLFDKDAKDVIGQDLDANVYVKQNEHMAFNHNYVLDDGSYLSDFGRDGGAQYHELIGDVDVTTFKTSDEVEEIIRKEEMIKAAESKLIDDDLDAYAYKVKDYTPDQLNALKQEDVRGYSDEKIQTVAEQYATQIMYYLEGIQSEDQLPTPEAKNRLHSDINDIAKRLIKKVKKQ